MGQPVIFVNIEGCLLPEYGNIDADYFQSMARISELIKEKFKGVFDHLRIYSGKDRSCTEVISEQLGIVNCWHIIAGGAYLFNPTTRETKPHPAISRKVRKDFRKILKWRVPRILKRYKILEYCPGEDVCIRLERKKGSPVDIERVFSIIRETHLRDWRRSQSILVTHSNDSIYIVPWMVNLGSAVKFLAEIDDIDLSGSLAIGASKADLPLFRSVGRVGCPSNALGECRDFVREKRGKSSLKHYAAGVIDIIEWYLNGSK